MLGALLHAALAQIYALAQADAAARGAHPPSAAARQPHHDRRAVLDQRCGDLRVQVEPYGERLSRPARQRIGAAEVVARRRPPPAARSEEHTSELPPLMRISYSVFCLK